jgi:polysaccharide pyruvyl transferase WcaK-like protein
VIPLKPFRGLTGLLVRIASDGASFVSVRDAYSYAVLRLTGVKRVILENDLALKMSVPSSDECKDLASRYSLVGGRVLGVNLRTLDEVTNRAVVDYVAGLIREFMGRGFTRVVFVPFGFGSFVGRFFDDDLIIARELKGRVKDLVVIDEELSPRQVLCLFNYLDHVIAMRHHAVIFTLLAGKPLMAIIYDTKTLELIKGIDKGNIETVDLRSLVEHA